MRGVWGLSMGFGRLGIDLLRGREDAMGRVLCECARGLLVCSRAMIDVYVMLLHEPIRCG